MTRKILFVNGPSQDPSDRFFGWPTPLLYAIAPTVQAVRNGDINLDVLYTISDSGSGVGSCWYSNDSYAGNISLTGCSNITSVVWSEGMHNVTVWVNDSVNNPFCFRNK